MRRVTRLGVLAVILAAGLWPLAGCSSDEPQSIGEVRKSRDGHWRDRWQEERAADAAPPQPTDEAAPVKPPTAAELEAARQQEALRSEFPQIDDGPAMTEEQDEAEADRDMPGKYR